MEPASVTSATRSPETPRGAEPCVPKTFCCVLCASVTSALSDVSWRYHNTVWILGPQHRTHTRVMDGILMPAILIEDVSHGPRRGNLGTALPWDQCSLPGTLKAVDAASICASSWLPVLPLRQDSSSWDSSSWLLDRSSTASMGSELPARTIYRPWCSPYSYFISPKSASQKHLPSSPLSSTWKPEDPKNLLEALASFSCSSEELQTPESIISRVSITIEDILAASQEQHVPKHGYKCMSCCRIFPTLCSVKNHIQHSSQEGYSCKVYYHKLKAMLEKECKEQETKSPEVPE
ncbi:spermatogenesis-associated protein 46 [Excalfactoria chinensis]|uniref:spermatogenesis-associated protein 46 n=1 Tax=Excalfactoria chinensis TaxID=46218 RepID=UPI003B3AB2B8